MLEHPVPQNITSYEFRLIGSMTLKQFFELMIGCGLGYLIYTTNLLAIIKFPLVLFFVLFGIALAFLPIEERPLDQWFWAFVRAIYNPTKFYWRKDKHVPDVFLDTVITTHYAQEQDEVTLALQRKHNQAQAYFQSLKPQQEAPEIDSMSQAASGIINLFDSVQVTPGTVIAHPLAPAKMVKPDVNVRVRGLHGGPVVFDQAEHNEKSLLEESPTVKREVAPTVLVSLDSEGEKAELKSLSVAEKVAGVGIVQQEVVQAEVLESQTLQNTQPQATTVAKTSNKLPFPNPPTSPNVVAGMVMDFNGKLIENAIVEIHTMEGLPVRAIKSNKLGQFFTSSSLAKGEYQVYVEKAGYQFEPLKLQAIGKVIEPLEIRAQETVH